MPKGSVGHCHQKCRTPDDLFTMQGGEGQERSGGNPPAQLSQPWRPLLRSAHDTRMWGWGCLCLYLPTHLCWTINTVHCIDQNEERQREDASMTWRIWKLDSITGYMRDLWLYKEFQGLVFENSTCLNTKIDPHINYGHSRDWRQHTY